jgi:hypothetical protein
VTTVLEDQRTRDLHDVASLLGRTPRAAFRVVVRDEDGRPAVIDNAPFLDDGTPMPTRYWLLNPGLCHAVSTLEGSGGVQRAARAVEPHLVAEAHRRYAAGRDARIHAEHQGPLPSGGVGGTRAGVKCLHAHLAWWLAGGDDPVGAWTATELGLTDRQVC